MNVWWLKNNIYIYIKKKTARTSNYYSYRFKWTIFWNIILFFFLRLVFLPVPLNTGLTESDCTWASDFFNNFLLLQSTTVSVVTTWNVVGTNDGIIRRARAPRPDSIRPWPEVWWGEGDIKNRIIFLEKKKIKNKPDNNVIQVSVYDYCCIIK